MKVLVTGATGFIGSRLVERFDDGITFAGTGRTEDSLWGALVRFQIDF